MVQVSTGSGVQAYPVVANLRRLRLLPAARRAHVRGRERAHDAAPLLPRHGARRARRGAARAGHRPPRSSPRSCRSSSAARRRCASRPARGCARCTSPTSDRDFRLFDVLLLLTAVRAAVGVLNGLLLSGLERAGELGVLRALGASRAQVAGTVLVESALVGLAGGALGAGHGRAALAADRARAGAALGARAPRTTRRRVDRGRPDRCAGADDAGRALSDLAMSRADPVRALRSGRVG